MAPIPTGLPGSPPAKPPSISVSLSKIGCSSAFIAETVEVLLVRATLNSSHPISSNFLEATATSSSLETLSESWSE